MSKVSVANPDNTLWEFTAYNAVKQEWVVKLCKTKNYAVKLFNKYSRDLDYSTVGYSWMADVESMPLSRAVKLAKVQSKL